MINHVARCILYTMLINFPGSILFVKLYIFFWCYIISVLQINRKQDWDHKARHDASCYIMYILPLHWVIAQYIYIALDAYHDMPCEPNLVSFTIPFCKLLISSPFFLLLITIYSCHISNQNTVVSTK